MSYEKKLASDGTPIYYKDGKRIKKTSIPKEQLQQWSQEASAGAIRDMGITVKDLESPTVPVTVDEQPPQTGRVKLDIPQNECVVCGGLGDMVRAYNTQTVYLCEDHYYSTTLGKIAQILRERATTNV